MLKEMHDSAVGGHSGILGTYQRSKQVCYWPGLKKDVHHYVSTCDVCQMHKHENIRPPGLLQPIEAPKGPWQGICMDFITGLPKSEGKEVIFVVVDRSFYQICSLYGSLILYKLPKLLKCSLIRFIPCMVYQLKSYQTETLYLPVFSGLSY